MKEYPNAQLVIAGGATLFDYQSYRDEFFALAHQLQIEISRSLVLPGVISDSELPALYRIADAFVFPSVKEGWGLVVLEAIASGLPVITSNQPPFTEFLSQTQALLVDPNSSDAIAQAMHSIVQPDHSISLVQQSQSVLASYTNFLFRRYTSTPPTPRCLGGSKKVSVASIKEIGITPGKPPPKCTCTTKLSRF